MKWTKINDKSAVSLVHSVSHTGLKAIDPCRFQKRPHLFCLFGTAKQQCPIAFVVVQKVQSSEGWTKAENPAFRRKRKWRAS